MVTPSPSPSTFQQGSTPSIVRLSPSPVISEVEHENAIIVILSGLTEANVGYVQQVKHNLFYS